MQTTYEAIATHVPPAARSSAPRWIGRVLTGLATAFLTFDAVMKIVHVAPVTEASARLGLPDSVNPGLGVVLAACLALSLIPRTAVLGAVLLTGYLGGAVAIHLRIGDPFASHTLFPVYMGVVIWLGLFLRDDRVRQLVRGR